MAALYVIEDRDALGVGLARVGLSMGDANRIRDALARTYPRHRYTVQPQRMVGRGRNRRVVYSENNQAEP